MISRAVVAFVKLKLSLVVIVAAEMLGGCAQSEPKQSVFAQQEYFSYELLESDFFHGTMVADFDRNHPKFPSADNRFPGGPAWFSINDPELSIWRAGQIIAGEPDEHPASDLLYLHRYRLAPKTRILDARGLNAPQFYLRYVNQGGDAMKPDLDPVVAAKEFFDKYPSYDAYLITDWVSGSKELVVKNPATAFKQRNALITFQLNAEYSCKSCLIERYVFDSKSEYGSYALIPSASCGNGYAIKKL